MQDVPVSSWIWILIVVIVAVVLVAVVVAIILRCRSDESRQCFHSKRRVDEKIITMMTESYDTIDTAIIPMNKLRFEECIVNGGKVPQWMH